MHVHIFVTGFVGYALWEMYSLKKAPENLLVKTMSKIRPWVCSTKLNDEVHEIKDWKMHLPMGKKQWSFPLKSCTPSLNKSFVCVSLKKKKEGQCLNNSILYHFSCILDFRFKPSTV